MRAVEAWKPSTFVLCQRRCRWVANRAHARGRLLDLGRGTVPVSGMYKDLVTETVCIDRAHSLPANPHLDIVADLNDPLPLSDASFDTAGTVAHAGRFLSDTP